MFLVKKRILKRTMKAKKITTINLTKQSLWMFKKLEKSLLKMARIANKRSQCLKRRRKRMIKLLTQLIRKMIIQEKVKKKRKRTRQRKQRVVRVKV